MAKKEVVSVWTGDGWNYHLNRRTGIVSRSQGGVTEYPDESVCEQIRRKVASRDRAAERRSGMDEAMRSIGMVKVRGNLGGIYWE